jgi:SAM-dependent methyltransferase
VAEALCLLADLGATAPAGGPLGEQGGVFWIALPESARETALGRLARLGYCTAVDALAPLPGGASPRGERAASVRWRGVAYRVARLYEEDAGTARESAPDRRLFLIEDAAGEVRAVRGYRGDGGATSRRALPVCDARLLVNLAAPPGGGRLLLDPFAGAGGIVREAVASGCLVASADLDPVVRHGLAGLGARHCVADAASLPFRPGAFDAVATEPPYHPEALPSVLGGLREIARVLRSGGRVALLCAAAQADPLRREAAMLGLEPFLDIPIDRKGLGVAALAWRKGLMPSPAVGLAPGDETRELA